MSDLAAKAATLLGLHEQDHAVVLPNVWDAWSARAVADAGFAALSIGSHPLADSRGQADNEGMTLDDALDGIRRITEAVDIPVTADMEAGYGAAPAELLERLLEAGAVGLNIEDTVHSEGGRLRSPSEHAEYIGELRVAADAAGIPVVINARTDVFIKPEGTFINPLQEAIDRLVVCAHAGARCVYPVVPPSLDAVRTIVESLSIPVNVTADPVKGAAVGSLDELNDIGVRRVTFGPLLQKALTPGLVSLVEDWPRS